MPDTCRTIPVRDTSPTNAAPAGVGTPETADASAAATARSALRSLRLDCWDGSRHLRARYRKLAFMEGAAVPEQGWRVRLFELPVDDVLR